MPVSAPPSSSPGLYGLTPENSSRGGDDLWGKNQFNSTFPLSLCIHMRDAGIDPVAVVAEKGSVFAQEGVWTMGEVIGRADDNPGYHFEQAFSPYSMYSRNENDSIDLVVSRNGTHQTALEIKLTVAPDSATSELDEREWARETARHVRSIYDVLHTKDYDYSGIYKGMPLGIQTDKAFSLTGEKSINYLKHERLRTPALGRNVLREIELNGGDKRLRPERRFDAAVQAHMADD